MHFYTIRHNNAHISQMPEIFEIVSGIEKVKCATCGTVVRNPIGDLAVKMGKSRAKLWPDVVACGDYPCFVVSNHFVNSMQRGSIRLIIGGKVILLPPIENGLSLDLAPKYFWIDGWKHHGGKMDFEASGYVNVKFCPECGTRSHDISLTYERQNITPPVPYVFSYDAEAGLDLFTTDLSPTAFFCNEKVLECASVNKLTNVRFSPVEEGIHGKPINYR